MSYEISTEIVPARSIAAVRRQVAVGGTSTAWRPALDQVWAFLRRNSSLRTDGHNIFVYHHPTRPGAPMDVEFGVEVTTAFEPEGDVVLSNTPGGMVAWTQHVGPVAGLAQANDAIGSWCAAQGLRLGGISWEIYGDPGDDPGTLDVRVFYLLG